MILSIILTISYFSAGVWNWFGHRKLRVLKHQHSPFWLHASPAGIWGMKNKQSGDV
jgi:hypothetical protein